MLLESLKTISNMLFVIEIAKIVFLRYYFYYDNLELVDPSKS